jgi:hypothetical protein
VKDNQKDLREDIETAFREPVSPPSRFGGIRRASDMAGLKAATSPSCRLVRCRSTPVAAGRRFAISRVSDAGESTFAKDEL